MAQGQKHASIKAKLQFSMILRDILEQKEYLDDAATYALHDMLGSYSPDKALLACAFTMKEVAIHQGDQISDLKFLHMECDRLIERYIARTELEEDNPELWEDTQNDMLHIIAEDLEGFLELTALCNLSFDITHKTLSEVTQIMLIQLQSQLMIVDQITELLCDQAQEDSLPSNITTGYSADNVVMFPV